MSRHRATSSSVSSGSADNASVSSGTVPTPKFELAKTIPQEMMPILTLLHAQKQRSYYEGYFMILNDLNSDGKPSTERKWVEVFGKLSGTVLAIWDADSLDRNLTDGNPTPTYINITDSTFKPIATLPSPSGDLSDIIVLSTTLKNRYLLQFANSQLLKDWTAAFRLSLFEYTSLQEAYTGALLSAKGSKLNGIRTLLTETKFHHEDWVSVRFGAGMPWKKCWTIVTPPTVKKKKNMPPPGTIAFYEDKKTKKAPLALITGSYTTYAVYPQNSVLINGSTLIKVEGKVAFNDVEGEKDAAVFLMPEPHPGVPGFETLIRFLVPVLDVFRLYGRPERLNADKNDIRSLLFAMPTLPFTQYLELSDAQQLVASSGSENWSAFEWTKNIKELLQRKLSTGYKGCGKLHRSNTVPKSTEGSISPFPEKTHERSRSTSFPTKPSSDNSQPNNFANPSTSASNGRIPASNASVAPSTSSFATSQVSKSYISDTASVNDNSYNQSNMNNRQQQNPNRGPVPINNPYQTGPGFQPPNNNSKTGLSVPRSQGLAALNTSNSSLPNLSGPITPVANNFDQNYGANQSGPSSNDSFMPPSGASSAAYRNSPQPSVNSPYRNSPSNSAANSAASLNNSMNPPRTPNFSRPPYASSPNGSNSSLNKPKPNVLPYPSSTNEPVIRASNPSYIPSNGAPSQNMQPMNRANPNGPNFNGPNTNTPNRNGPNPNGPNPSGPQPMNRLNPNGPQPMNRPPQQYPGGPRPPPSQQYPSNGPNGSNGSRPPYGGPPPQQANRQAPPQQYPPSNQYPGPWPIQQANPPYPNTRGPPQPNGQMRAPMPNSLQPSGPRPIQPGPSNMFDPTSNIPNHNHTVGERTYPQQYRSMLG